MDVEIMATDAQGQGYGSRLANCLKSILVSHSRRANAIAILLLQSMNVKKTKTFWGERVYLQKSDAGASASQLYNELRALDSTVSEYSRVTPMVLVIDYTEYDADVWESGCEASERTQPPSQPPSQSPSTQQQPL
eukprot:2435428-Prymnesium_polylepis.1